MSQQTQGLKQGSKFKGDMEEASKLTNRSNWSPSNLYKVNNFATYLNDEKQIIFDYLRTDLQLAERTNNELKNKINQLNEEFLIKAEEVKELTDLKLEIKNQKEITKQIQIEKFDLDVKFKDLQKISLSWSHSALRAAKCVNDQVPFQVQAIIGEDYAVGAAMADVCRMNPEKNSEYVLKNTFKKKINGKDIYTNMFVKETGQFSKNQSTDDQNNVQMSDETYADEPSVSADGSIASADEQVLNEFKTSTSVGATFVNADEPSATSVPTDGTSAKSNIVHKNVNDKCNSKWTSKSTQALKNAEKGKGKHGCKPQIKILKNPNHIPKDKAIQPVLSNVEMQFCSIAKKLEEKLNLLSNQVQKMFSSNCKKNTVHPCNKKIPTKLRERKCYNCGQRSHEAKACPNANNRPINKSLTSSKSQSINNKEIFINSINSQNQMPTSVFNEPIARWVPKSI